METEIIFQHGWAFDGNTWQAWVKAMTKNWTASAVRGERGYFGAGATTPIFSADAVNKTVVAHSFGAHLIAPSTIAAADTVILVNSFVSLKPNARAIRSMLKKFAANPEDVVLDFWRNCYTPEAAGLTIMPPHGMNTSALEQDLVAMQESTLDIEALRAVPNVVLVQSDADRIVPQEVHRELHEVVPHARTIELAGGCHAAHLTQAYTCLQMISHWSNRNRVETCQTQKS